MTSSIAIRAENLGKYYRVFKSPRARLAQGFWGQRRQLYQEKWALQDVSFDLPTGQTLGVIGRNGSGKSTLLQLLCGTLTPSQGHVACKGRIAALLELGSGFNPEFSGLENVYLNASLLGLTQQETEDKLEAILAFADIGEYIHHPVKTYSSGMGLRLSFAVQANIDPDIFIVDEALAVGDELFQKKCYQRLESLKEKGASILLVTHSCTQINQQCDLAMLLHNGLSLMIGQPQEVTFTYQQLLNQPSNNWADLMAQRSHDTHEIGISTKQNQGGRQNLAHHGLSEQALISQSAMSYAEHGVKITSVEVLNNEQQPTSRLTEGRPFSIRFNYTAAQAFSDAIFTCYISSHTGIHVSGQSLPENNNCGVTVEAGSDFTIDFYFEGRIWSGMYFVGGGVSSPSSEYRFIHRVVDWAVFRVHSESATKTHGAANLSRKPPILTINESK
jgi:lipopolysaccharide transport system ATP-binding protein